MHLDPTAGGAGATLVAYGNGAVAPASFQLSTATVDLGANETSREVVITNVGNQASGIRVSGQTAAITANVPPRRTIIPPGNSTAFTVTVNRARLPVGPFSADLRFDPTTGGAGAGLVVLGTVAIRTVPPPPPPPLPDLAGPLSLSLEYTHYWVSGTRAGATRLTSVPGACSAADRCYSGAPDWYRAESGVPESSQFAVTLSRQNGTLTLNGTDHTSSSGSDQIFTATETKPESRIFQGTMHELSTGRTAEIILASCAADPSAPGCDRV